MSDMKISEFNVSTSLTDSDLFTFVVNNTNKNVTFDSFKTALGVTGTIQQAGDPLAAPVLDTSGTTYNIRNMESGAGVMASVSAQNGVVFNWNVSQDATGIALTSGLSNSIPTISSLVAGTGISITKTLDAVTVTNTVDPATGLSNRVVVTQASDLAGVLDSTKEYFLDGVIDMGSQSIEVPDDGLSIVGYSFDLSKLISSENNYTMLTSPVGGSGNIIGRDFAFEVTGTSSKVHGITDSNGTHAFEFARVNYNNCTSLGSITNYRQGLEVGTGRFGGQPELELIGSWAGGYFIDTSIVRGLTDGAYTLFKAGAGFLMSSRFRSNMNVDLPASASLFDFSPANFVNPSTLQIDGAIVTRDGVFDSTDANITPNIDQTNVTSNWMGNNGMPNTFVGGSIGVTTELETTIAVANTFVDLAATLWTSSDLQHFSTPSGSQLKHLGNTPREFKVTANFAIDSIAGDDITLRVVRWDDSAATNITVLDQTREINNFVGGRDVAFFNIDINTTLDQNDYIFLQVANVAATNNVTAEADSYYIVEAR